jgi:hypothetical protein
MTNIAKTATEINGDFPTYIQYQVCQHCDNVFWRHNEPFGPEGCGCVRDPSRGPQPGDAVRIVGEHNVFNSYKGRVGIVEGFPHWAPGQVHICLGAYGRYRDGHYVSLSGGPWILAVAHQLKNIGTQDVWFWKWGKYGQGARKGEQYKLTVTLWEFDIGRLR